MLIGFREGVKEGTYQGKQLRYIAMGIEFLDNMIRQSSVNLTAAVQSDKIEKQGGKIHGTYPNS